MLKKPNVKLCLVAACSDPHGRQTATSYYSFQFGLLRDPNAISVRSLRNPPAIALLIR